MLVTEALNARYCVRAFRPDPVDRKTLEAIFEAALRAPSWANTQPWEVFVAGGDALNRLRAAYQEQLKNCAPRNPDLPAPKQWPPALLKRMETLRGERLAVLEKLCADNETLKDLSQMNYRFFDAPVVAYLCMDRTLSPWSVFDLGLLAQSIMLAAQQYGVGSAPAITLAAHPELVRTELKVPDDLSIVIGIALGYADAGSPQNQYRSNRRPVKEVVRFSGV